MDQSLRTLSEIHKAACDRLVAKLDATDYQRETGGTEAFHLDYSVISNGYGQDAGTHLGMRITFEDVIPVEARQQTGIAAFLRAPMRVELRYDVTPNEQIQAYRKTIDATGAILRVLLNTGAWLPEGDCVPTSRFTADLSEDGTFYLGAVSVELLIQEGL